MNKDHYDEFAKYMEAEIASTRDAGQNEYASPNNVFEDFVQTAELTGTTPAMVLYTFLNKHMRGIGAYVRGVKSQREHVSGRIKDAIVYLQLLWAMVEEEESTHDKGTNAHLDEIEELQDPNYHLGRGPYHEYAMTHTADRDDESK